MHIALQGCLKAGSIPYGLTADTGGHIRYLLELVEALSDRPEISHQIIVTRAFDAPHLGEAYNRLEEQISDKVTLWRFRGYSSAYLPKEEIWKELPHLTDSLLRKMQQRNIKPNLIHAHYADAGVVAMRLKAALAIPYVFTGHSLGATKAQHRPANSALGNDLKRRIRYEEITIKHADSVIASSEHEAQVQYGMYRYHDASKILLNPPGCKLGIIRLNASKTVGGQVDSELKRFLKEPNRPCLLAIARPVEKKNLCALVRAYGEHPKLRYNANLVIYAGTRIGIESGEPEACRVWTQLLQLIDDYDLYGYVAYPKYHTLDQIPAIYQWAVKRQGVFVNPALNEPFGLTLLEAAAAGLPVVTTREGGPVDILGRCGHGLLVSPTDIQAIGDACRRLISSDLEWQRYSSRGYRNVDYYTWSRHAEQYVSDMRFPISECPAAPGIRQVSQILATDMDGTLLGDKVGLTRLAAWLALNRQCLFIVATGRSLTAALSELTAWASPLPDFLITDVGSAIYRLDPRGQPQLITSWHRRLSKGWRRAECERLLCRHPGLVPQPQDTQSDYKLSFFTRNTQTSTLAATNGFNHTRRPVAWHDETIKEEVEQALASVGLAARVVYSHGNLLDILPESSGKAHAVDFLRERFNIDRDEIIAAGDSGNDIDLLQYAAHGIVVANHSSELKRLQHSSSLYWAKTEYAAGVLEGLQRLEIRGKWIEAGDGHDFTKILG
ncbi:HAD-IIB family hydrolase [uncultured Marinobacter sp.]|uniref:HAD-IIB family hydrolase n=1 Tax=uncultured Marinobacter sp. TaxID=187379 RepID=UPI002623933E|nr:HAD-IIB family hydrolase [uncultured Marinobacter sp.]